MRRILKTGRNIPISDARRVGVSHGYSQVIIVAWDSLTGTESVTTWGQSLLDNNQAAIGGNFVRKALGWPKNRTEGKLTLNKTSRIKPDEKESDEKTSNHSTDN